MFARNLETAIQFAPIVERVHGVNHPELTRVRELTQSLQQAKSHTQKAKLFAELRTVTNNYVLPDDACEAFTATYQSLESEDAAHSV